MEYLIEDWINHLTQPRSELSGFSVCPFAKGAKYEVIETDGDNINPPSIDFELIIYKLPDHYTIETIISIADRYNKMFSNLVFLPDPKNRNTFINGVQTNNGEYNLILCQHREKLNQARKKLQGTSYYSYWSEEYLKEIIST